VRTSLRGACHRQPAARQMPAMRRPHHREAVFDVWCRGNQRWLWHQFAPRIVLRAWRRLRDLIAGRRPARRRGNGGWLTPPAVVNLPWWPQDARITPVPYSTESAAKSARGLSHDLRVTAAASTGFCGMPARPSIIEPPFCPRRPFSSVATFAPCRPAGPRQGTFAVSAEFGPFPSEAPVRLALSGATHSERAS